MSLLRSKLADTEERIDGQDGEVKSRTDHREYGRVPFITYSPIEDRFTKIEYDAGLGRNREIAPLATDDLVG